MHPDYQNPNPQPVEFPELEAEIQIHFSKDPHPTFEFVTMNSEEIQVTPDGEITVPDDRKVVLTFTLTEASDASAIEGIQLGWFGPALIRTEGLYPMPQLPKDMVTKLPFLVKPLLGADGVRQGLVLTDLNDPVCGVLSYQLYVSDTVGNRFSHDPKIYNKGDGSFRDR